MKYSDNLDYLIAAIIYLGTQTDYWGRTPSGLSSELRLDKNKLTSVLESFQGIFRRTEKKSENGEYYFSLQARHAQREGSSTGDPRGCEAIQPLGNDRMRLVIDFVTLMATQEQAVLVNRRSNFTATICAVIAAGAALYATFHK